ncbi:F0F1 ATP synthase subunit B [Aliikangiella marina]|uniref:ATP synthase subunit b n=1 Tax=Aliikangiella marina TaxID=1712262 RepID=A0A545T1G4_9GAMM|nr:F0F1 ATP synthase subunit B [Aliikangiella marina]TQV71050.1 F0F1 ATP synthase subunit B [Aliikangiella marina]
MDFNATLFGQTFAMIVFVWFTMKYIWPLLDEAITERQEKIAEGLAAADRSQQDLELAQKKAAETMREAKEKAAELLDQAKKRHAEIVDSAKDDARAEADKIKAGAQAEIEQEVHRAREELRKQVSVLAVAGAEKILQRNIDASAQADILDKLVAEL